MSRESRPLEFCPGVRLFLGDKARMERFFPTLGYNAAMRHIIHQKLNELEASLPTQVVPEIDLDPPK